MENPWYIVDIEGGMMQLNMYSNIGFRCESAYLAFTDYLDNKRINTVIFDDSRRILNDCLQIDRHDENSLRFDEMKNIEIENIQNILHEYIMAHENKKAVFEQLKRIYINIENINNLENEQIKELCVFFKEIVKLCKYRAQFNHHHADDDYW